jgi:uncharacterized protein (TIGR01244 family)
MLTASTIGVMMKCPSYKKIALGVGALVLATGLYLGGLQLTNNFHETVPGELYRSAQLSPDDLTRYVKQYGIRTVINLRGANEKQVWYVREVEAAKASGVQHMDFRMSSHRDLTQDQASALIDMMRNAPKPILIHCRSGSDRTGLAAALYIAAVKKGTEFNSEWQMSLFYGHIGLPYTSAYPMNETFESLEPWLGYFDS